MMQMASPFCSAVLVKEAKQPDEGDLVFFVPTLNEAGSELGRGANERGESMLACECVLLRKWPSALSSSTGGH